MRLRRRKRSRVSITEVRQPNPESGESRLYALLPESYDGPWDLMPGTVLEVVSTPKEESSR